MIDFMIQKKSGVLQSYEHINLIKSLLKSISKALYRTATLKSKKENM